MKRTVLFLCFFSFSFLCCSPEEENKILLEQNKELKARNAELSQQKDVLCIEVSNLNEQKASALESIAAAQKELGIYHERRQPVYIVKFEISLRKNLDLRTYEAEFELPVSKEYFDSAEVGKQAPTNIDAYKTLSISFVTADCTIRGKRII